MSTLVADNPQEQAKFNSMAEALKNLPLEAIAEPPPVETQPKPPETKPAEAPPQKPPDKPVTTEAPPAAVKPSEENPLESTKGLSPKAAEKFEAIKKARDEFKSKAEQIEADKKNLETQVAEFNKQIAELKQTPKTVPELEALKKERDQLNEILNVIRLEENPSFQQKWTGKVTEQLELAKSVVGPLLADKATRILTMPDGPDKTAKLEELKAELTDDQLDELKDVRKNLRLIDLQRNTELKQSREKYKELKGQEDAQRQKQSEELQNLFKGVGAKLADPKDGWAVFQKTDNVEWNRAVDERIADAEAIFSGKLPVDKVAEKAYHAAAFPAVLQFTKNLMEQNKKLTEQIAGMSAASPKPSDGGKPVPPTTKSEILSSSSPQSATEAWTKSFIKGMNEESS